MKFENFFRKVQETQTHHQAQSAPCKKRHAIISKQLCIILKKGQDKKKQWPKNKKIVFHKYMKVILQGRTHRDLYNNFAQLQLRGLPMCNIESENIIE